MHMVGVFEAKNRLTALLDSVMETGAVAPLTAERRGRISALARSRLTGALQALPISIDDETASRAWPATAQLAVSDALTAYDATYLEPALGQPCRLQPPTKH